MADFWLSEASSFRHQCVLVFRNVKIVMFLFQKQDNSRSKLVKPSASTTLSKESTKTPEPKSSASTNKRPREEEKQTIDACLIFQCHQEILNENHINEIKKLRIISNQCSREKNFQNATATLKNDVRRRDKELADLPSIWNHYRQVLAEAAEKWVKKFNLLRLSVKPIFFQVRRVWNNGERFDTGL